MVEFAARPQLSIEYVK